MGAKIMKSTAMRLGLHSVLNDVANGDDIVVQRYDKLVAVVIGFEDYVALQDELDDLRSARRAQTALNAWRDDPSLARSWEEVKREYHEADLE